jgi:hypothetical protein
MAPKDQAAAKPTPFAETICEPGRHVNCLHTKMAEKRAAGKKR